MKNKGTKYKTKIKELPKAGNGWDITKNILTSGISGYIKGNGFAIRFRLLYATLCLRYSKYRCREDVEEIQLDT